MKAEQIHVDTTSFSVSGEYTQETNETADPDPTVIAITSGYSRDHREGLKQWMLALATTHDGDIPLFMQPLDGNSSDKASLLSAITSIQSQLQETDEQASVYVADNGVYSEANMRRLNQTGVTWISRVSETLTPAKTMLEQGSETWQHSEDATVHWFSRQVSLPQGNERWVVIYMAASVERVRQTMQRQVSLAQSRWEHTCWHLSNRRFACEVDARAALEREVKDKPAWIEVQSQIIAHPQYGSKGRPRQDESPTSTQWQLLATVSVNFAHVVQEVFRKACWIVGTNVLESEGLSDQALVTTYKEQGGVERGFRFLKDPLFLASSVFVKKPERIMALSFIMVLCLLVYRLAEFRVRSRLAETQQTIPDQIHKPTSRPTMRGIFQCFEGIELLHIHTPTSSQMVVLRLQSVHHLILQLLGPQYEKIYNPSS